jgi:hypothetical protein
MEALVAAIGKIDNVAIILLTMACFGLGWLHVVWRKEEREDRARMLEAFNAIVSALNDLRVSHAATIGELRAAIAAMTGRHP